MSASSPPRILRRAVPALVALAALLVLVAGCPHQPPPKRRPAHRVEKRPVKPRPQAPARHKPHEHAHGAHPHDGGGHHHHPHPHPHMEGKNGHHHPY